MTARMTNWAGNVAFSARRRHEPASQDELIKLVARLPRVRALGAGHSFSRVADTTGDLVSLARMPGVLTIDPALSQATVSAGTRYAELAGPLHRAGYALANLASLPHLSVAGACATGTHGSGRGNRSLAAAVAALDLVTASGEVVRLHRGGEAGALAGAVISLGALGIVSSLMLDLVPAFDLRQYVYEDMPAGELEGNLAEVFASGYSVSVFTTWQGERVRQVWLKRLAGQQAPPRRWLGARLADGQRHPVPGASPSACTTQLGVPGPWHERLPHFRADAVPSSGDELQSEYLLPAEQAVDALRAIRRIGAEVVPALQVSEIRMVAADEQWLSPSYRRDTVAVHFTWISDSRAVTPAISAVERELLPLGALPHWGKLSAISPASLVSRYQRAADFARLRRELDPAAKFGNELTGALFPPAG